MKILFVCLGNICRSPMAEFVMKRLVAEAGLAAEFEIASAATGAYELGNPVYPPARKKMAEHGLDCSGKTAQLLTRNDYEYYNMLVGMDHSNLERMGRTCGGDPDGKFSLLLDYTPHPGDVADPWYTGDFDATWRDVNAGCEGLLAQICAQYGFESRK